MDLNSGGGHQTAMLILYVLQIKNARKMAQVRQVDFMIEWRTTQCGVFFFYLSSDGDVRLETTRKGLPHAFFCWPRCELSRHVRSSD